MSKLPLIGIHRRPSVDFNTSFLDMKLPPLPRERAEEEAMALLYLYDREAWAYLTGFTVLVGLWQAIRYRIGPWRLLPGFGWGR